MILIDFQGRVVIDPGTVTLDVIEKAVLEATLKAVSQKKRAAEALGISRSALYSKLKRHGLWRTPCALCGGEGHEAAHHDSQLPAGTSPPRSHSPIPPDGGDTPAPPGAAS